MLPKGASKDLKKRAESLLGEKLGDSSKVLQKCVKRICDQVSNIKRSNRIQEHGFEKTLRSIIDKENANGIAKFHAKIGKSEVLMKRCEVLESQLAKMEKQQAAYEKGAKKFERVQKDFEA